MDFSAADIRSANIPVSKAIIQILYREHRHPVVPKRTHQARPRRLDRFLAYQPQQFAQIRGNPIQPNVPKRLKTSIRGALDAVE